jgi:hypothetical protein
MVLILLEQDLGQQAGAGNASLPESFFIPFKYSAKVQKISDNKEYFVL